MIYANSYANFAAILEPMQTINRVSTRGQHNNQRFPFTARRLFDKNLHRQRRYNKKGN